MITKVLKTIEAYQMLSPDSAVVAGVSGGADSMALLHVLQSRRKDWPELKVTAAHVNHCLRGAEADRDEEHVRRYCQREGIPLEVLKIDVREEAAKRKTLLDVVLKFSAMVGYNSLVTEFIMSKSYIAIIIALLMYWYPFICAGMPISCITFVTIASTCA